MWLSCAAVPARLREEKEREERRREYQTAAGTKRPCGYWVSCLGPNTQSESEREREIEREELQSEREIARARAMLKGSILGG